ncbi:MAG TPA: large conductance mechanosensitive channel protein MscL [Pyrinomonadaceae bacterium]|jgi:large conductance mechanosensitive channel
MWKEFKAFIARGNILDLAIAVILGAAFGKIVTTMVEKIIMPPIGWLTKGLDFSKLYYDLSGKYNDLQDPKAVEDALKGGAPLIMYGQLITDVIQFLIIAFVAFIIARWALGFFKVLEKPPAPPTGEEVLLAEIRDILKGDNKGAGIVKES